MMSILASIFFACLLISSEVKAQVYNLPVSGVISDEVQDGMNPAVDYSKFSGRVSDTDQQARVMKVKVENNNSKFFRSGDKVLFYINEKFSSRPCTGFVRNVEDFYFTIYVESLDHCYEENAYFRRGTILNFDASILANRVFEAHLYRKQLVDRKQSFLKQLNDINHFLWSFEQQKIKTAAQYDQQITDLMNEKNQALDNLISQKQENLILQSALIKKLSELDGFLDFYKVQRQELLTDRWNMDHDQGLPVGQRPQNIKK